MADLVQKGVDACKAGDFENGVDFFSEALALDFNNQHALYHRARAFSKLGKLEQASEDFEQLKQLNPIDPTIIGDYAVSLHLLSKNEAAGREFDLALNLEPLNPYRHSSRAYFRDRIGDLEGAIADYEEAVRLDPEDAIAFNNKGLVEEKLGRKASSIASFNKSNQVLGYEPDLKETSPSRKPELEKTKQPIQDRKSIIRSVFTKDGFQDFWRFTKSLFSKKD